MVKVGLYAKLEEEVKTRLDLYAYNNGLRLNEAVEKILDENLPKYEIKELEE